MNTKLKQNTRFRQMIDLVRVLDVKARRADECMEVKRFKSLSALGGIGVGVQSDE
jgi:hypothetical protein